MAKENKICMIMQYNRNMELNTIGFSQIWHDVVFQEVDLAMPQTTKVL